MQKFKPGQQVRGKGLPKFLITLSALILSLVIFDSITKYIFGIHSLETTHEDYVDYGYTMRFIQLIVFFGVSGFAIKKLFGK
mmetsp:Transcript_6778/g.5927  ORF Transcript_6778/g.5927 Transcript_6778/m.5927 type:complete len:82 (+) Transcript_6778:458-703(+)